MRRHTIAPRPNWQATVERQGFTFHSGGDRPEDDSGTYWFEGAAYELSAAEVDLIEAASEELHRLCLSAVARVANDPAWLRRFAIPDQYHDMIRRSWERQDPYVYGRFDLAFDGHAVKLLEYNADTPTTLIESALIQWYWLQEVFPDKAAKGLQFNSIHEKLIGRWGEIRTQMPPSARMHFSSIKPSMEEFATVEYLRDTASQATPRLDGTFVHIEDIEGFSDRAKGCWFEDLEGSRIDFWFKLYPWEWLYRERFGPLFPALAERMGIVEPPWKALLSNKALLAVLWEMDPGHPNLLPAFMHPDASLGTEFVTKPILGREGQNIEIHSADPARRLSMPGSYGDAPTLWQSLFLPPKVGGQHVIIGSWMVGDKSAGIIIREDDGPIITSESRAVPHFFSEAP